MQKRVHAAKTAFKATLQGLVTLEEWEGSLRDKALDVQTGLKNLQAFLALCQPGHHPVQIPDKPSMGAAADDGTDGREGQLMKTTKAVKAMKATQVTKAMKAKKTVLTPAQHHKATE